MGFGSPSPYSFMWDAGAGSQTTAAATALQAGTYYVTVIMDINQDGEILNFEIAEDDSLMVNEVAMCTDVDRDGNIANWIAF